MLEGYRREPKQSVEELKRRTAARFRELSRQNARFASIEVQEEGDHISTRTVIPGQDDAPSGEVDAEDVEG